jgi:hypothetical protein
MAGLFKYKPSKKGLKEAAELRKVKVGSGPTHGPKMEGAVPKPKAPPKINVPPTKTAAAAKKLESLPAEMRAKTGAMRRKMKRTHPQQYKEIMQKKGQKRVAARQAAKAEAGKMTKPPAGTKMATKAEAKALAQKGVKEVRAKAAAKADVDLGKRVGAAKKVKIAARVQQAGAPVTRKIRTPDENLGRRVGAEKKVMEAAKAQQAGRPVTKPVKPKLLPATASGSAPQAAKGPGLGARVRGTGRKVMGKVKMKGMESFFKGKVPAEGAGRIAGAKAGLGRIARRAAPGAAAGAALGAAAGDAKTGAGVGAAFSLLAPRIVAKSALPVAAATSAVDIGRATYHGVQAKKAAGHVKRHAQAAKKAGYKVTRKTFMGAMTQKGAMGFLMGEAGDPGIKITKVGKGKVKPGAAPPWARKKSRRK